jgi:hypothetical protein
MTVDLFGDQIAAPAHPLEEDLLGYDESTFAARLSRLEYLHQVFPENYSFLMTMSSFYVFEEARRTFINGEMVGTILLSQAFIEHWLQAQLEGKGYVFGRSKQGLSYILKCLREKKLLHSFLIDKIDNLRKLRNPFVHLRPFDDPQEISRRSVDAKRTPDQVLEGDAKEALSLMYRIAITRI